MAELKHLSGTVSIVALAVPTPEWQCQTKGHAQRPHECYGTVTHILIDEGHDRDIFFVCDDCAREFIDNFEEDYFDAG